MCIYMLAGEEFVDWLTVEFFVNREEAISLGLLLLEEKRIACVWPEGCNEFLDGNECFYAFKVNDSLETFTDLRAKATPRRSLSVSDLDDMGSPETFKRIGASDTDRVQGILSDESRLITEEDERQIEELLKSRSVHDLDRISEELSKELVRLETSNINSLIKSHESIKEIWTGLSKAQEELSDLSLTNTNLQIELDAISTTFEQIEKKNNRMAVITRNQQKLLDVLTKILDKITLDRETIHILENGGMEAGKPLEQTIKAAYALHNAIHHDLQGEFVHMKCVSQQMDIFLKLRNQFAKRARAYINTLFKQVSEFLPPVRGIEIPSHHPIYRPLLQCKALVHWVRQTEAEIKITQEKTVVPEVVEDPHNRTPTTPETWVTTDYSLHISPVWKKELKYFIYYLRKSIMKEKTEKLSFKTDFSILETLRLKDLGRKLSGTSRERSEASSRAIDPPSESEWGDNSEESESEFDDELTETSYKAMKKGKEKYNVIKAFTIGLQTLIPRILEEQEFVKDYFQFTSSYELDKFLGDLMEGLSDDLSTIIDRAFKINRFYCMSLWVEIRSFISEYKDKSSFILELLNKLKKKTTELLYKYVNDQIKYIQETKPSSVRGIGVLPHTKKIPTFIDRMEECGASAGPELSVETYNKLISVLYEWLMHLGEDEYSRLAVRFENFHHLHMQLKYRSIPALEKWCSEAKRIYDESLSNYVKLLVYKRFSTQIDFFDGVDKLYQTVPAENIKYQRTHSNLVIAKLILKFSIDYVETGLWKEYKRINRDLSEETGLIPDVWNTLKTYFTQKYKHFEDIVSECYKEQKLSFTSSELVERYKIIEDRWVQKLRKEKRKTYSFIPGLKVDDDLSSER